MGVCWGQKLIGKLRKVRILAFAAIYFIITFIYLFNIPNIWSTPEVQHYVQNPAEALRVILSEITQNPFVILPLLILAFYSLALGLITEIALNYLKRHTSKWEEVQKGSMP